MSFPFKHNTQKETFKFTFLNEVAFKLSFANSLEAVSFEAWQSFFKDTFGLEFSTLRHDEMMDTRIKVGNEQKGLMFEFSRTTVKISLTQQAYSNYHHSLEPGIRLLVENLVKIVDTCKNVEMKFVDVWPFSEDKDFSDEDIRNLEHAIFSKELQDVANTIDDNFKMTLSEEDSIKLHIKYGSFNSPDKSDKASGVALETKCELRDRDSDFYLNEVVNIASKMNDVLYNAFIWSVSPLIINMMKDQEKKNS